MFFEHMLQERLGCIGELYFPISAAGFGLAPNDVLFLNEKFEIATF